MGGVGRDHITGQPTTPYPDSTPVVKQTLILTSGWAQYSFDLTGRDLSYVLGGFGWVASDAVNPGGAVFYLDDIEYQLSSAARTARLNQPRFLRSFETEPYQSQPAPVNDFDFVLRNIAFTYDNALAVLTVLAEGSPDGLRRALLIGDAFVYAAEHDRTYDDGRLRDAYAAGDIALPPGWTPNGRTGTVPMPGFYIDATQTFVEIEQGHISSGNNAWVMIALLAVHKASGDARYLAAALKIAEFVEGFRQNTGNYQGFRQDGPALTSQIPRLTTSLGKCGIPLSASTLVVNVTVVAPMSSGYLTIYPGNQTVQPTSTINFRPGETRANNALLLLAPDETGTIGLLPVMTGGGTVHVILDVSGYFE